MNSRDTHDQNGHLSMRDRMAARAVRRMAALRDLADEIGTMVGQGEDVFLDEGTALSNRLDKTCRAARGAFSAYVSAANTGVSQAGRYRPKARSVREDPW